MQQDFMADDAPQKLKDALGAKADVVLSDMAHNTTNHKIRPFKDHGLGRSRI